MSEAPLEEAQNTPAPPARSAMRRRAAQARKRLLWRLFWGAVALLALLDWRVQSLFSPVSQTSHPIPVQIAQGASVTQIANRLESAGVIRSAFAFRLYVRWNGGGARFRAGRYALDSSLTLDRVIQTLQSGGNAPSEGRITIPEGYTLEQIAETLERKGVTSKSAFLQVVQTPDGIKSLIAPFPLPKETLEGYLYPDTYDFQRGETPKEVAQAMLNNFADKFYLPNQKEIESQSQNLHALLTIAAMVEREAKVSEDRPLIAGVIANRLAKNMRLEIDATVLYALGEHKSRVLFSDLRVESPYNTYRVKGLPPGPIANPGQASLLAALRPNANPYLYYVARPDGSHLFSRTLAEHESAKRLARRERSQ